MLNIRKIRIVTVWSWAVSRSNDSILLFYECFIESGPSLTWRQQMTDLTTLI